MKKYISLLLFFTSLLSGAQHLTLPDSKLKNTFLPGLNGFATIAAYEAGKNNKYSFLKTYYGIDPRDSAALLHGLLQTYKPALSENVRAILTSYTCTEANIFTFSVRLSDFNRLCNQPELKYISLDRKISPQVGPSSRNDAGINKVHSGAGLPMPYTGKGVLCGLVDVSLEYNHPAFKTENGDSSRVIAAWAQNLSKGTAPAAYNYGVEFKNQEEVSKAEFDSIIGLHGTITLGAMAGSGYGSEGLYKGPASDSKIIAVTSNVSESSLLDAANYFFLKAKELNKRGVFNLSWGSHSGPHDGTSLFDQAIDGIARKGGIVVGAAGNWGSEPLHLKHSSGTVPDTTSTIIFNYDTARPTIIDVWGKPSSTFRIQVRTINKTTGKVGIATSNVSTLKEGLNEFRLPQGKDTTFIYLVMTPRDASNDRSNCVIYILHNHITTNTHIGFKITSVNNEVHAWGAQNAVFSNKTFLNTEVPGFKSGDTQYTIAEIGGTSKSIITVGAHVSQQKFKNFFGETKTFAADSGMIEPFSGYGPTLDGRIKPDLTAPGTILAPVNSFYMDINNSPERFSVLEGSSFFQNGKTYYWLGEQATSFAAPVVAGSIAVLLEASPEMNYQDVKSALLGNTTNDSFTGEVRKNGSSRWGYGKLNLFQAISSSLVITGENEVSGKKEFWYSNPVQDILVVYAPHIQTDAKLSVYDLLGRPLNNEGLELISKEGFFYLYNSSPLKTGQYVAVLKSQDGFNKTLTLVKR